MKLQIRQAPGNEVGQDATAKKGKRITLHLLRHSFSRWTLDAGIDISYLQQQLGHASLSTTAIYLRARPNHCRKVQEKAGFNKFLNPVC